MNPAIYNISLLAGLVMVGVGVAMVSVPAALVTVGVVLIALTLSGAYFASRKG